MTVASDSPFVSLQVVGYSLCGYKFLCMALIGMKRKVFGEPKKYTECKVCEKTFLNRDKGGIEHVKLIIATHCTAND